MSEQNDDRGDDEPADVDQAYDAEADKVRWTIGSSEAGEGPAEAVVVGRPGAGAQTDDDLESAVDDYELKSRKFDLWLRKVIGIVLFALMVGQIWFANWLFFLYVKAVGRDIDPAVAQVWIVATVVEVIGLVFVVVKYFFSPQAAPRRPRRKS